MAGFVRRRRNAQTLHFVGLVLLCVTASSQADDSIAAGIQRCAAIAAPMDRLACFDALADVSESARGVVPAKSESARDTAADPAPAPVAVPAMAESPSDITPEPAPDTVAASAPEAAAPTAKTLDELDAETSPRESRSKDEKLLVRARVTRCEKDARKKYYFVFENGQVWKQVSERRLRYKKCEFDVTITKDFFGYKMQPDGESRRVSIARVK